jgi:PAS domain S-box-containing protein
MKNLKTAYRDKLAVNDEQPISRVKEKEAQDIAVKKPEGLRHAAQQSSQYARSLIEASLDPLVTISPEGKITDVNEASVKVTGETREKLIGTDFSDYFTEPEKARQGYKQVFEKEFVSDYPLTIRHKNGTLTDVLYNASVYKNDKGNVLGVFAAARDIAAQKQASQYARSLIEASLDPLVTISTEGKITDVNEASAKVTGETREKLIGTDFSDYFTEPEKARQGYKQVFEKGFVSDYPLTIHHKNGTLTDVLYNASVYKDDKGNVLGVFAAARDVTHQKRITEELQEARIGAELATIFAEDAKVLAESALQSKQQFLANMSHEIRTPLNAILGFTKIVLKTDLAARQKEYLDAIKTSSDGLLVLINDILDLAKVDAGKMTFEQTPFKMDFSISTVFQMFDLKIQEKNLELLKEYDSKIPEVLIGDAPRLQQILLNLLSNALKFTEKGKIIVGIRLLHEDKQNATIEFAITDTGSGIPEDKLESIFENFQQATSSTSRMFGGTGLGLAICKQLVEKQGGTIAVKSKVNEGSTFSFALSFQKTNEESNAENAQVELEREIKDIKILVVEDVKLNQLLMRVILDDFKFKYDIADNGKIAIEKMQTETYDIILMDLQMPEMNGFEATDYIRNTMNLKIPIIALTADVTTVDIEKCKAFGMNEYISKPLDERVLYNKIVELLKK